MTLKLKDAFNDSGKDMLKLMALGSDGASTMTGCKNGVGTQLKRENPFLIQFHCVAHKLALCTSQAAEGVPLLTKYKDTMRSIYYYFKGSHCRSDKLKAIQEILDSPLLKVKEIHDVRWFAFYDSLRVIYQCLEALAQTFNAAKDPKAKGLYKAITAYSFVALSYFLIAIIPVVTRLNMKFQRSDLDISMVGPSVQLTIHELDVLCENCQFTKSLNEEITTECGMQYPKGVEITVNNKERSAFDSASKQFISKLKSNLEARFPSETLSLTNAAEVLALRGLCFVNKDEVLEYGNEKLSVALEHYGASKKTSDGSIIEPVINLDEAKEEWKLVKQMIRDDHSL